MNNIYILTEQNKSQYCILERELNKPTRLIGTNEKQKKKKPSKCKSAWKNSMTIVSTPNHILT